MENEIKQEVTESVEVAPKEAVKTEIDDKSILETLKKENLEMQAEIKKREELIAQRNELRAREMISGNANAGTPIKTPQQEKAELVDKQVKEALARYK